MIGLIEKNENLLSSRYVYDKYVNKEISKELFEFLKVQAHISPPLNNENHYELGMD